MKLAFSAGIVPATYAADAAVVGSLDLARHIADTDDGEVRVTSSKDILPILGYTLHVSISVGKPGTLNAFRKPTEDEVQQVLALWPGAKFEEDVSQTYIARHYWEVK